MPEKRTIFHLSDIHFGLEDRRALEWVETEIAERRPDAVIITGDLTMRARDHEFAAAQEWIARLPVPVDIGIGNHDMPAYHLPLRYLDPYRRFERFAKDNATPIAWPELAIVHLNTSPPAQWRMNWSKGAVSARDLAQCLGKIDALPKDTSVLVAAHHPLRESGTHGTALTRGGSEALEALAGRNVLGVLSGHVHDPFDISEKTDRGSVRMIGAGTLSHRLRSTPASFNMLTWEDGDLSVEVCSLTGVDTEDMQLDTVPEDAIPPMSDEEPIAPVAQRPSSD